MLERSLGTLRPEAEAGLLAHLSTCPACSAAAAAGADLDAALALLDTEPPFEVDVAGRVLDAIAEIGPPRREAVPERQLAWASLAAVMLAVAILVSGAFLAPAMLGHARDAGRLTVEAGGVFARLGRAAIGTLATTKPLFGAAWDLFVASSVLIRKAEPLIQGAAAVIFLVMAILTSAVIGRDLRARVPADRR